MFAVTSKTPGEGRRAYSPSAYFFFAHEQRVNLQEEYPDATISAIQKTSAQLWQKMNTSERAPYEELALVERERGICAVTPLGKPTFEVLTPSTPSINTPAGGPSFSELEVQAPSTLSVNILANDDSFSELGEQADVEFLPTSSWTAINTPGRQNDTSSTSSTQPVVSGSAISEQQMLIGISSTFFSVVETEHDDRPYIYTVSVLKLPLGVYREHQESIIHFYLNMTAANNYLRHLCERRLNLDDPMSCYAHGTNSDQGLWFERTDENGNGYRILAKKRCVDVDGRRERKVQEEWGNPHARIRHQPK
ncbi:HMG-box [Glarea lozoyensis ATCC 20868]|uniref:HMG-box n=1 Tax=Glarea lozoyensis (strain ATCC 20868 / MF5171) TaxID=1116229 RepID=S3DY56_GLAL2|nr:HMG-box [Glarea lozoyensis ATCC 20868]EPE36836.1 HMG-box [Glarea lozoyensis ATCC 20868]